MFDTIEEIEKNKYLNNLVEVASAYNMYGTYIKYNNADNPRYNGVYFICGYSPDVIKDPSMNIEALYKQQQMDERFPMQRQIVKITNASPYATHKTVSDYCYYASAMRGICNMCEFGKELTYVDPDFITECTNMYKASVNPQASVEHRIAHQNALRHFVEKVGNFNFATKGKNVDGPDVHLRPEKITRKSPPNMVTLPELVCQTNGTKNLVVDRKYLPALKKELDKRPHILYFQAKPVIIRPFVDERYLQYGYKPLQAATVQFVYNADYAQELDLIMMKIQSPHFFEYSMKDIKAYGNGATCRFGVCQADMDKVFEAAKKNGIPICVDTKNLYFNCNPAYATPEDMSGYTVVIPKSKLKEMDKILYNDCRAFDARRILTPDDDRMYNNNYAVKNKEVSETPTVISPSDIDIR